MGAYIGIDLGTTFSAVAVIDETGRPIVIHNSDGQNVTPSCITSDDGVIVVGEVARKTWGVDPTQAVARFKREMGTDTSYSINGDEFSPTQLSALVLKKIKQDAERQVGEINEAVVTIPANFANEAREATMQAAKDAGLEVKFIINEPTAAALYYAFRSGEDLGGTYAVYDLGGGTFDISIINVNGQNVDVLASNGIHKLGGDDFDRALQGIVAKKYKDLTGEELDLEDYALNQAEEEKKSLSNRSRVVAKVGRQVIEVRRDEFEAAVSPLIGQAEMICETSLDEAGIDRSKLGGVFLAGGSTRIPAVMQSVEKTFGMKPTSTVNVDEVVSLGAALYAAYKSDGKGLNPAQKGAVAGLVVTEATTKCFGTIAVSHNSNKGAHELSNSVLITKGSKIPCSVTESFLTIADGQEAVECIVTESSAPETDPRFVKQIWKGELALPGGRPADQEVRVTFSYDANQIMKCKFLDVSSGRENVVDLSMSSSTEAGANKIDKFLVE